MNARLRKIRNNSIQETYTLEELEFLRAIDRYKRENHRPNPSWREVLQIVYSLGYRKIPHGPSLDRLDSVPLSDTVLASLRLDNPSETPPPPGASYPQPTSTMEDGGDGSSENLRGSAVEAPSAPGEEDCGERGRGSNGTR